MRTESPKLSSDLHMLAMACVPHTSIYPVLDGFYVSLILARVILEEMRKVPPDWPKAHNLDCYGRSYPWAGGLCAVRKQAEQATREE